MISTTCILLSLMALVFCVPSAEAHEISLEALAGGSQHVTALNVGPTMQLSPRKAAVVVGKLPQNYFRSTPAQSPEIQTSASHSMANMLVIIGLATMLFIGMAIIGLYIIRRRHHSTPAKIILSA